MVMAHEHEKNLAILSAVGGQGIGGNGHNGEEA
jgi:hypothetical protein